MINISIKVLIVFILFSITFSCKRPGKTDIKIENIIQQMTLKEKLDFIGGYEAFNIRALDRLGVPSTHMSDGPVGLSTYGSMTAYAAGPALAASFDKHLARSVGSAIGSEARAHNVHMILGPGLNICRSPLCGRNFEYFGEDPYLAGQIGAAFVKGIQDKGVIAVVKHYAANNQEYDRHRVSSEMDERTLQEIYLPAFKATVQEGKAASIMTAYNSVNGVHCSQNDYLINQVLKKDWGFEGFVMCDWRSTYDGVACAKAGLDLEMPDAWRMRPDTLLAAINSGRLDVKVIDDKIRRILKMYERFDYFNNPVINKGFTADTAFIRATALEEARGGTVLLKNENNFLPVNKSSIKKIAIIGPNGHPASTGGGGSSLTTPLHPLSLFRAMERIAGPQVEVTWTQGVDIGRKLPVDFFETFDCYYYKNGKKEKGAIADFYSNTTLKGKIALSTTFKNISLQANDMFFDNLPKNYFSTRFICYYRPVKSANYLFGIRADDGYRLFIDGAKTIESWKDQDAIGKYERYLEADKEYKIELEYYQGSGRGLVQFSAALAPEKQLKHEDYIQQAIDLAKKSDLVVLAVGFDTDTESEGFDRTFDLPYHQNDLIKAVEAVNPNSVIVLFGGGNVNMNPWIDQIKGLIHAWYPGQEGALAVAEILYGVTNPSGKLPVSFEKNAEDNPTYNNYWDNDQDKKVFYKEGIFMGYRYYDQSDVKPRFPFGFGLSYTTFAYSNLKIEKSGNNIYNVSVDIKNTADREGAEAVQLYVGQEKCSVPRPKKELKDFGKVTLKPGETKTVQMQLDGGAFQFFDPAKRMWVTEPGDFTIYVGASSADIKLKNTITL